MAAKGYLVFKECIGLRKLGRNRRHIVEEYPIGKELEIWHTTPDAELFVKEGVVDVFDHNHRPCKWEDLFPPEQEPLIVNKVRPTTRPVKVRKK